MIENDKPRCLEFAQMILGKAAKRNEIDVIIDSCETFAEFRVALILKFEDSIASVRKVVARWRESINTHRTSSDGNDLMRTAELLALKHSEIERKLRDGTAEMLDKLKAIDAFTTQQKDMRDKLAAMTDLISQFRKQIAPGELVSVANGYDGNDLMHTAEVLALNQSEMQQKLRESTAEMLDKLKAIDSLATLQVSLRSGLSEIKDLVFQFQKQISHTELVVRSKEI